MTDLTDRMRTCAAAMLYEAGPGKTEMQWQEIYRDAADLLIEASNVLDAAPPPLGEPMEVIPPLPPSDAASAAEWMRPLAQGSPTFPPGTWVAIGDTLPVARLRSRYACPKCDSRTNKKVRRVDNKLMIECPVCAETWEYK